jgi:hypothetical protein
MLETLSLDHIQTDGGTQPREYLNELVLGEYTEAMANGAEFPPLVLFYDGRHYWLADGFHRFFAAKKHGVEGICAEVHQGTRRDALLYAAGANATHGLRRTNADKRRAVLTLLQDAEWQRWSNREIARQCGVTHAFVGKLRRDIVAKPPARPESTPGTMQTSGSERDAFDASEGGESRMSLSYLYDTPTDTPLASDGVPRVAPAMYEPLQPTENIVVPRFGVPRSETAAGAGDGPNATIEDLAAVSRQTPADWMAEMIAYWLLDVAKQYDGVTSTVVKQVAERLVIQYHRVLQEIASVTEAEPEELRSDALSAES